MHRSDARVKAHRLPQYGESDHKQANSRNQTTILPHTIPCFQEKETVEVVAEVVAEAEAETSEDEEEDVGEMTYKQKKVQGKEYEK